MCLDSIVKVYPTKLTDGLGRGVGWERKDDSRDVGLSQRSMVVLSSSVGKLVGRAPFWTCSLGGLFATQGEVPRGQPFPPTPFFARSRAPHQRCYWHFV